MNMNKNPFEVSTEVPSFNKKEVNNDTRNVFGDTLREVREASGNILKDIAEELKVPESLCLEWEQGKSKPEAFMLSNVARAYGCSFEEINFAFWRNKSTKSHHKKDKVILQPTSRGRRIPPRITKSR